MMKFDGFASIPLRLNGTLQRYPITLGEVASLARFSVVHSNDYRGAKANSMNPAAFGELFNEFIGASSGTDVATINAGHIDQFLLAMGNLEFEHQGSARTLIPRTLLLYGEHWRGDPLDPVLEELFGVDLTTLLVVGLGLWSVAMNEPRPGEIPQSPWVASPLAFALPDGAHARLTAQLVGDYRSIRRASAPAKRGELRVASPFAQFPLVQPDDRRGAPWAIAPVPQFLIYRFTSNLFFDLQHRLGSHFRRQAGEAFERYVGQLLERSLPKGSVLPERRIGSRGETWKTVDWIVVEGDQGTLVEVKLLLLRQSTRTVARAEDVARDLGSKLSRAVDQLVRSSSAVVSHPELADLHHVREWEHLVVTLQPIHFGDLLRRAWEREEQHPGFYFHLCDANNLEQLVAECDSLSTALRGKRQNEVESRRDFKDWIAASGREHPTNSFLDRVFDEFGEVFRSMTDGSPTPA